MFTTLARSRAPAKVVAASAGAVSTSSTISASALAPQVHAPSISLTSACQESLYEDEGWVIADRNHQSGDILLFRPFQAEETEHAIQQVMGEIDNLVTRGPQSSGSGSTSPGEDIDEIIALTNIHQPIEPAQTLSLRLSTLQNLSQKIASSPTIQSELARLLLNDEALVNELLQHGIDLDDLSTFTLHQPAASNLIPFIAQASKLKGGQKEDPPLHHHLLKACKEALDATGSACHWLSGWFRDRASEIGDMFSHNLKEDLTDGEEIDVGSERQKQKQKKTSVTQALVDASLIILSIALVLLIFKRPLSSCFKIIRKARV